MAFIVAVEKVSNGWIIANLNSVGKPEHSVAKTLDETLAIVREVLERPAEKPGEGRFTAEELAEEFLKRGQA